MDSEKLDKLNQICSRPDKAEVADIMMASILDLYEIDFVHTLDSKEMESELGMAVDENLLLFAYLAQLLSGYYCRGILSAIYDEPDKRKYINSLRKLNIDVVANAISKIYEEMTVDELDDPPKKITRERALEFETLVSEEMKFIDENENEIFEILIKFVLCNKESFVTIVDRVWESELY